MKILGTFLLGLLLLLPTAAGPPVEVDNAARAFAGQQQTRQNAAFNRDQRYTQIFPRMAEVRANGVVILNDDPPRSAGKNRNPPNPAEVEFRVDVYESPQGWGYTVVSIWTDENGQTWKRSENHGPLEWMNHDWEPVQ